MTIRKPTKFFPQEETKEEGVTSAAAENPASTATPLLSTAPEAQATTIPSVQAYPVPPTESAKETTTINTATTKGNSFHITLCGDYVLKSTRVAKRNTYICLCGNHTFDLRQASFPEKVSINIIKLCGDLRLIVPPSVTVSACAVMLCGDRRMEVECNGGTGPHVKLHIVKLCGDIVVTNEEED